MSPAGLASLWQKIFGGAPVERERFDWPRLLDIVQFMPAGTEVELTVQHGDAEPRTVTLAPVVAESDFIAARGFWFKPIERIRKADSFGEQVRYGWDETTEALSMVFRFLQKIGGQVPVSALGGPVTIAKAAGYSAAEGISSLLIFLTMLEREPGGAQPAADSAARRRPSGVSGLRRHPRPAGERKIRCRDAHRRLRVDRQLDAVRARARFEYHSAESVDPPSRGGPRMSPLRTIGGMCPHGTCRLAACLCQMPCSTLERRLG